MKKLIMVAMLALLAGCQQATEEKGEKAAQSTAAELQEQDKMAYAIGAQMGSYIRKDAEQYPDLGLKSELVIRGFKDAIEGQSKLDEQELMAQFQVFQEKLRVAQTKQQEIARAENLKKGQAFLAENAKREGVVTTDSGLQYEVIKAGNEAARKPKANDVVKVHYTGTFIDGKKFDSSVDRGQPAEFPLDRVIKGWTEGVQLMSVGSKYKFYIPANLAYGENDRGPIPGNSVLVFEVELLDIIDQDKKTDAADK